MLLRYETKALLKATMIENRGQMLDPLTAGES